MSLHVDLLSSIKQSPRARGGRIEIGSAGPRDSVMITGDREGLVRLTLAILDHVSSRGEDESTFARDIFGEVSEIQTVILTTISEIPKPPRTTPPRPSLLRQVVRLLFG